MKLHAILSAAAIAASLVSLNVFAEDPAKPAAPAAQGKEAVKGHNHECENKGVGCTSKPAALAVKKAQKSKGRHDHECEMKHTGCQDPTK